VDVRLVDPKIPEDLLDRLEGAAEELLKSGTGVRGVEVDPLKEGVDFDGGLRSEGEGLLGTLASGAEKTEGAELGG
jgi:hypothetical protein